MVLARVAIACHTPPSAWGKAWTGISGVRGYGPVVHAGDRRTGNGGTARRQARYSHPNRFNRRCSKVLTTRIPSITAG